MAAMKPIKRSTWTNFIKEVRAEPLSIWEPSTLNEIRGIVKGGHKHNIQIKAVGSGHSWSTVCQTNGFLIKPNKLNKTLPLRTQFLKDHVDTSHLVEVQSGITVKALNKELDKKGLALPNMGGYDGQTIIGVASTSTHGSGIKHGPMSDLIQSIDIVAKDGDVFRIEPANGITDPVKFKPVHEVGTLIQDDKFFNAVKVSIGCMGVIYSVILKVRDAFNLQEVRTLSNWETVKEDLRARTVLTKNEHYEILINPYKVNGKHECLITTRNTRLDSQNLSKADKKRRFFTELLSSSKPVTRTIFKLFNDKPENAPKLISKALKALKDNSYFNKSFKVFNIGAANDIASYSSEIMLPIKHNQYIKGIDHMLTVIKENADRGNLFHTGPISFRFIKGSEAFLSPMYKQDSCAIEIIMMKKTFGARAMYDSIEKELYSFGARIHWGQINSLTADVVKTMYPMLDEWKEVRQQLDPGGIFSNSFSDRINL